MPKQVTILDVIRDAIILLPSGQVRDDMRGIYEMIDYTRRGRVGHLTNFGATIIREEKEAGQ